MNKTPKKLKKKYTYTVPYHSRDDAKAWFSLATQAQAQTQYSYFTMKTALTQA